MTQPFLEICTREQRIELALEAMSWIVGDDSIPADARIAVNAAHTALHKCRAPETVARMEREIFDRLPPHDQELFLRAGGKL